MKLIPEDQGVKFSRVPPGLRLGTSKFRLGTSQSRPATSKKRSLTYWDPATQQPS